MAGTDARSEPAWNADCCSRVAITATTMSTYSSGVASSRAPPSIRRMCITILVSTATTPNSTPTATASRIARRQPVSRTATARQHRTNTMLIPATSTAVGSEPS